MLNFKHAIPTTIYFGKGQVKAIRKELTGRCVTKVLLVTGTGSIKKNGIYTAVTAEMKAAKIPFVECAGIVPNPRLSSVRAGIDLARKEKVDFVLAVGGGSVIDAAKAMAVGALYAGDVWNFYTHTAQPATALPIGAVLTLAATGSEMNGNSVITDETTHRKLAFGSALVRPAFSVLDPEYTFSVDRRNTAAGVVDIMIHIFEQYFSHTTATDVQNRLAEGLLKVCIANGPIVMKDPTNYDARANILWAGSLALNNLVGDGKVQDWATHMIEHELSAVYDITHGVGLAILNPQWMRYVLGQKTVGKFADYGINVWNIDAARDQMSIAREAIDRTHDFFVSLDMPRSLRDIQIGDDHIDSMAENVIATCGGSVGQFKELKKDDVVKIFRMAL